LNESVLGFERQEGELAGKLKRGPERIQQIEGLLAGLTDGSTKKAALISSLETRRAQTDSKLSEQRAAVRRLAEQWELERGSLRAEAQLQLQKAFSEKAAAEENHSKALLRLRTQYESEKASLENRMSDCEAQLRSARAEAAQATDRVERLQDATSDHGKLVKRVAFLEQNYQEASQAKAQLEAQLRQLLGERQESQVKLAQAATLGSQLRRLEGDNATLKLQSMQSDVLCRSATKERDKLVTQNEELSEQIQRFKQSEKTLPRDLADCDSK
jgi:chromosome segregation ATPase